MRRVHIWSIILKQLKKVVAFTGSFFFLFHSLFKLIQKIKSKPETSNCLNSMIQRNKGAHNEQEMQRNSVKVPIMTSNSRKRQFYCVFFFFFWKPLSLISFPKSMQICILQVERKIKLLLFRTICIKCYSIIMQIYRINAGLITMSCSVLGV